METALADTLLVVHFLFIAFVLGGQGCILIGAYRNWSWIRRKGFRTAHLIAIVIVVALSWASMVCPLTIWENSLRRAAGEAEYNGTFIDFWVTKVIYYHAPSWVFTTAYTLFGIMVLASWFFIKPIGRKQQQAETGRCGSGNVCP